jgi:predicted transposase YdaD
VETILAYKLKNLTREEIEAMFTLGDLKQTRVYQDAYREGRQEGKQEGRQEGRQEGELRTILRQLTRKLGTLSPQLINQITSLPIERLDDLADAVLDMQTLDDLMQWLA